MLHKIKEFVELCKKEFGRNLVSIVLFGSWAKGKQHEFSDFDFYVVVKKEDEATRWRIMKEFSSNCDIVMRAEDDLEYYLRNLNALDLNVISTGKNIYGKDVIKRYGNLLKGVKKEYNLINREQLGKGVWEIGAAG